jgi:hypothetical protein
VIVWVSEHAADRFAQRVRPGLDPAQARDELARLVREFGRRVEWPEWCHARSEKGFGVEVSDGVVVVVEPSSDRRGRLVAVTVKVRGGAGPEHEHRGQGRRARKHGRRVARSVKGRAPWPEFEEAR